MVVYNSTTDQLTTDLSYILNIFADLYTQRCPFNGLIVVLFVPLSRLYIKTPHLQFCSA